MRTWIVFLRGINVGGNTIVSMRDLAALFTSLGLSDVRTYINSGNVVLRSALTEARLRKQIEAALVEMTGRPIAVAIRNAAELSAILTANPFPGAAPSQVGVMLLSDSPSPDVLEGVSTAGPEEVRLGTREIYIHYPDGMGNSKLRLPVALKSGTVRNINTITKLAAMAQAAPA